MELKEMQEKISNILLSCLKRDNVTTSDDYFILKIGEEVGELMQAYLIHKKKCRPVKHKSEEESKKELAKELADVAGLVFATATHFDIDLEEEVVKKWITREWIK